MQINDRIKAKDRRIINLDGSTSIGEVHGTVLSAYPAREMFWALFDGEQSPEVFVGANSYEVVGCVSIAPNITLKRQALNEFLAPKIKKHSH